MLTSNSVAALCDRCLMAVASASWASASACSASMFAGCASRAVAALSARLSLSLAAASSTGANSGAPDCSARCTDALATAILSFGIGVLPHPATANTAAAIIAPRIRIEVSAFTIDFPLLDPAGTAADHCLASMRCNPVASSLATSVIFAASRIGLTVAPANRPACSFPMP